MTDLLDICERVVRRARRLGPTQAEAFGERTREATVRVRDGEVEDLTRAEGKGLGLRVFIEGRLGFAFTSDFTDEGLDLFVRRAVALAGAAGRDPANKLPDERILRVRNPELHGLFDPEIEALDADWKIEAAKTMERAGRGEDKRIAGYESVGAGDFVAETAIHSSEGLHERYRGTYVYLFAAPVAKGEDGQLQTSYWVDYKRRLRDLETPEEVGRIAARRAARMLGAKKVKTQRVPVIFEPTIAASFVAGIAAGVNGDLVRKGSSFLGDKLGKRVAPESITIVDDGLLPGGISTAPFDGEGIATRRTAVIERGVLTNFLYDSATARKARAKPTGNARRGYSSLPSIGVTNFHLEAGDVPAQSIVKGVKNGLYVTAMLGRGANTVTGDYSRGANGIWIRDGEFAEAVQEITVAGNMLDMLANIDAVGDDIDFRGSLGAPTIRFAELTVSGS